jgi:NADH dehydrogenase FAD-containing subunit
MGGAVSTSSSSASDPPPASVIIVGASFAGLAAARTLLHARHGKDKRPLRVTLIEPRDYFEYTPGILRAFVAPEHAEGLCVPLEE